MTLCMKNHERFDKFLTRHGAIECYRRYLDPAKIDNSRVPTTGLHMGARSANLRSVRQFLKASPAVPSGNG